MPLKESAVLNSFHVVTIAIDSIRNAYNIITVAVVRPGSSLVSFVHTDVTQIDSLTTINKNPIWHQETERKLIVVALSVSFKVEEIRKSERLVFLNLCDGKFESFTKRRICTACMHAVSSWIWEREKVLFGTCRFLSFKGKGVMCDYVSLKIWFDGGGCQNLVVDREMLRLGNELGSERLDGQKITKCPNEFPNTKAGIRFSCISC